MVKKFKRTDKCPFCKAIQEKYYMHSHGWSKPGMGDQSIYGYSCKKCKTSYDVIYVWTCKRTVVRK